MRSSSFYSFRHAAIFRRASHSSLTATHVQTFIPFCCGFRLNVHQRNVTFDARGPKVSAGQLRPLVAANRCASTPAARELPPASRAPCLELLQRPIISLRCACLSTSHSSSFRRIYTSLRTEETRPGPTIRLTDTRHIVYTSNAFQKTT